MIEWLTKIRDKRFEQLKIEADLEEKAKALETILEEPDLDVPSEGIYA